MGRSLLTTSSRTLHANGPRRHVARALAAACVWLASACTPGIVWTDEPGPCALDEPDGTCPSGEICVEGVCTIDCASACGGACAPCDVGSTCTDDTDCASELCRGDVCREVHCANGDLDGDETGIDCGGSCGACSGGGCTGPEDCASGVCDTGSGACADPACDDGVHNGLETDLDCGGSCVVSGQRCPDGATCSVPADCESGICDGTCQAPAPHCSNSDIDAGETDLNCGGGECPACDDGLACAAASDCLNGVCGVANDCPGPSLCACQAPDCNDGVQNGSETGLDCGGDCALPINGTKTCGPGTPCGVAADCDSGVCNVTCQAPSCAPADGVLNGSETAIDCGGPSCPTCADGEACESGSDCQSGVCGVDNLCPVPPCTCEGGPSCSDGVLNQDELAVDCGGVCLLQGLTCPPGTACDDHAQCSTGFCNGTQCQSSCLPPDGLPNGFETDIDCGGPVCPGCDIGETCVNPGDCLSGACSSSGVCESVSCGDGVLAASEECDDNGTPAPNTGDDLLGGRTCVDFSFSGGSLSCSATCAIDVSACTGGCGNGARDPSEQCDGTDLGGATCETLGYDPGPGLACASDCSFDVAGCNSTSCPTCPPGSTCSAATDYLCTCPLYQTSCLSGCKNLLTDPLNCGSCGNDCVGTEVCSAGDCQSGCPTPLIACANRCIDPQVDATFCGATAGCDPLTNSDGTDCATTGQICLSGVCVDASLGDDYTGAGDAGTRCEGGGPVLDVNTGLGCDPTVPNDPDCVVPPEIGCTGALAAITFRYALCSCGDIDTSHPLFADGFNSTVGPYDPQCEDGTPCTLPGTNMGQCTSDANGDGHRTCADQTGAGVGANGIFDNSQLTTVWGTMWLSNGNPATYPDQSLPPTTIEQELHIGNTLSGGPVQVRGNGYVVNDITATGACDGTLFQSTGTTSTMAAATVDRSADPLVVPEACDCAPSKLIDIGAIVDAHACEPQGTNGCDGFDCCTASNNHNAAIGLDPTLLDNFSENLRLDLPCGNYNFTRILAGNNTTVSIIAHGRTAIYVDGHMDIPKILNITLTDSAELDVFVKGGVCNNDTIFVGSPSYPARVRFYVGGGDLFPGGSGTTCATNNDRGVAIKSIIGAANIYAPYGEVYMPQTFTLYGSIFAGRAYIVQTATFHFDTGISSAGETCDTCGNGVVDPGEECDGSSLGGRTCADLGYTGGPLQCLPTCEFDTRPCCGDGTRGGVEECDGTDLNGSTCATFGQTGTLSCSATCTFEGCTAGACVHNGVLEAGEECDQGAPPEPVADVFPAALDTCSEVLGFVADGTLSCDAGCQIDPSLCTYCGDGELNGFEECDGDDFDPAPGEQNEPPACPVGVGQVTCDADCELDLSECVGCNDCRDCGGQACIGGVCDLCESSADCCAPMLCNAGTCSL